MIGIQYLKVPPTMYVMQYRKGKLVREGAGLSFYYFAPHSTIVQIPVGSNDVPFVFEEVTADFQDATIQGELSYRIHKPDQAAKVLDFSLRQNGRYQTDDFTKVGERLVNAAQVLAHGFTQQALLRDVLVSSPALVEHVLVGLRDSQVAAMLGVEILGLSILSIKPTPAMARALEADAREALLQREEEAISARRNTAVELERQIRENELKTEILVQQKQREVRETKMGADIAVEEQRAKLVDQHVANQRKEAEARGDALRAVLEPLKGVDWRTLLAASSGASDPATQISMAFRELAENAEKIGTLNITPDLLQNIMETKNEHATTRGGRGGDR